MSARFNLQKELSRWSADHALIATYTFNPEFFERYCLEELKGLAANSNVTVLVDQRTYDDAISGPPQERARLANIRYLLHPVAAARTFHPKLVLLATRTRGLLIVGSANFTRQGLFR
ncbi:MAG: phospholipase D family protein [Myxococcales bacterium]|nr:phospholipase D family protein [Myxococcales bacterium]MCB9756609.1 phospholipase D family protein [Myxococcales bacterium]